ncbi:GNAT family N-acetyltransferase [Haloferula helveola]|uniref:GNAT family N-acetyltransferase n=1 Tax=Haloferula helveola TaxID=490095 RepID=A0ABN6H4J2_9BACT|nr:GNAT family N-acetyltransferase [Haloferula helveola]
MKTFLTERLLLRPMQVTDAEPITCLLQERRVVETLAVVPWPYQRHHADEWLVRILGAQEDGRFHTFAITLRDGGEFVGVIGIHPEANGFWAEVGYWLGIDHWGRGYMTEALQEMIRYGFEELGLRRVESHHFAHNPASGRVMQKAGMNYEGSQKLRAARFDQLYDRVNYGLTDDEWRAAAIELRTTGENARTT